MPQITKPSLALAMLCCLLALLLAGCGDKNSNANYDPDRGEHPSGWLPSGHAAAAFGQMNSCTPCHGSDFNGGGISKVACSQCHLGNQTNVHPLGWGHFAYALHSEYVEANGTGACANVNCHGTNLQGGAGPSCSSCHLGGPLSAHPTNWVRRFTTAPGIAPTNLPDHGDYVNANGAARCSQAVCHGTGEPGGILQTGRSCTACHF